MDLRSHPWGDPRSSRMIDVDGDASIRMNLGDLETVATTGITNAALTKSTAECVSRSNRASRYLASARGPGARTFQDSSVRIVITRATLN